MKQFSFFLMCALFLLLFLYSFSFDSSGLIISPLSPDAPSPSLFVEHFIPETSKVVEQGDSFLVSVTLLKIGDSQRKDLYLDSRIMNEHNDLVALDSKTLAVETRASIVIAFPLPLTTPPGLYTLVSTVSHEGMNDAVARSTFTVVAKESPPSLLSFPGATIIITLLIFISFLLLVLLKKRHQRH